MISSSRKAGQLVVAIARSVPLMLCLLLAAACAGSELEPDLLLPAQYWVGGVWEGVEGDVETVRYGYGVTRDDLHAPIYPYQRRGLEISYSVEGEGDLILWDIETYTQLDGLRKYVTLWRASTSQSATDELRPDSLWRASASAISEGRLPEGAPSEETLDELRPDSLAGWLMVDFECYVEDAERKYVALWHDRGPSSNLGLTSMSLDEMKNGSVGRIVDIEQCFGSDASEPYLVLVDLDGEWGKTEVGRGDWEEFHDAYHLRNSREEPTADFLDVLELESFPVSSTDGEASEWEFLWVWIPLSSDGAGSFATAALDSDGCEVPGRTSQAIDWSIFTNDWFRLDNEIGCRDRASSGELPDWNDECGFSCHRALQLVDLLIGTDEIPEHAFDEGQHRPTHGDGSGT